MSRLLVSEFVGARAIILDSINENIVGVKGIITSVSSSCYYMLVDVIPNLKSNCTSSTTTTNEYKNVSKPRLGQIMRIIKDQCNVGIVLPEINHLSSNQVKLTDTSESSNIPAKTPSKSNLSIEVDSEVGSFSSDENEEDESENVSIVEPNSQSSTVDIVDSENDYSFKVFGWNEKSESVKLCVLYGKYFMPHCKFEDRL